MAIALYARKSIERENSISCDTQLEYCKSMIRPDEQNEKVITFVDNGFSGGNIDRDGFQDMMRQVERGKISKIIVYRLDRITRSLSDYINILNFLKQYDVKLISSQEPIDTSNPYGEMFLTQLVLFAELERKSIIERVTQAYSHRSELGFYMGGRRPYGFDLEPTLINNVKTKKLSPITEEISQIKYIYDSYAAPNVTLGRLLKNLVENDINPLSGGNWTTAKLSTILKNPIYVKADNRIYEYFQRLNANIISPPESFDGIHGIQIYGKTHHEAGNPDWSDIKVVVMSHEGVIDSDIWIKCQQKLSKNKQVRNSVSNKTSWLGGKIICGRCGRTMTTIKGKTGSGETRRYFNCTGKSHFKNCKGPKNTIYAQSLEDMVYQEISEKLEELKSVKITEKKNLNPEINVLRNKLKSIELDEQKLADTLLKADVGAELLDILNQRAVKLKGDKIELLSKIDEFENASLDVKTAVNLSKKWKTATFEERRGVCNILISRIIIDDNGNAEIVWNL